VDELAKYAAQVAQPILAVNMDLLYANYLSQNAKYLSLPILLLRQSIILAIYYISVKCCLSLQLHFFTYYGQLSACLLNSTDNF